MNPTSLKRLLVSGYFWAFSGRLIIAVAGMVGNMLLARLLAPENLGNYFLLVSLITIVSMLSLVGQQRAIVPAVSSAIAEGNKERACSCIKLSFFIVLVSSLFIGVLLLRFGGELLSNLLGSEALKSVMWITALLLIVRSLSSMFAETFRAFHNIRGAVFFNGVFVNVAFVLMLSGLFLLRGNSSLLTIIQVSFVAYGLNIVVAWYASRSWCENIAKINYEYVKNMLHVGLPLMVTGLAMFVTSQADIWIIGSLLDEGSVAVYGAAVKLVQLVAIPLMITNAVLPSIISALKARGDLMMLEKVLRVTALVSGIPAFLMLFVIMFNAEQILGLVYGEYYKAGSNVLMIVSIGQIINVAAGAGMVVLMVVGLQLFAMYSSLVAGVVLVIAGIFAARNFGIEGVSMVVSIVLALQAVFVLFVVKVKVGVWSHIGFDGVGSLLKYIKSRGVISE